jgi:glutaconate CoA-transferase subunit A
MNTAKAASDMAGTANENAGKVMTAEAALGSIPAGALLGVGGVLHDNKPIALERALMRSGASGLRYIGLSGAGYDLDLLIAAGVISEVLVPVVSFEELGFAPAYRWAVENAAIKVHIVEVASLMAGYFASASGVPFHPVTAVAGSDVTRFNPLLSSVVQQDGSTVPVVAAIAPDVALIHVQEADCHGNGRAYGATQQAERLLARTAKRVILSCDRLVPTSHFEADPHATTIPGMYVDAVCHLPMGAHPSGSPGQYAPDHPYLKQYWQTVDGARRNKDRAAVTAYLDRYVYGCKEHEHYLDEIGGAAVVELMMGRSQ